MTKTNLTQIILLFIIFTIIICYINNNDDFINSDTIDAYIYINLENREDRKQLILNELKKLDIPENKIHKISGIYIPKNGHKGNVQSFILAITLAKLNKWKTIMICEDDMLVIQPDKFNNVLSLFKKNNIKWNCIMYGQRYGTKIDTNILEIKRIKNASTKTCIVIPEHMYDIFLENFNNSNDMMSSHRKTTDDFEKHASDQTWKVLQEKYNFYCLSNEIVVQRNIWSSTMRDSYGKK